MKNKVLISAVLILAVLSLGALAGIALFTRNEPEVATIDQKEIAGKTNEPAVVATDQKETAVEAAELKVVTGLLKTHYHAGERIWLSKHLYNLGDNPLAFWGADSILFFRVYDEQNRVVISKIPEPQPGSPRELTLNPGVPDFGGSWTEHYTFALDQPGRYKVVAWAELSLDKNFADPLHIYADPLWIEIITGRNVEFWPVELHKEAATPEEVRSWVQNSLKFDISDFANAKEFDGKQYLFVRSGIGGRDGPKPFERLVQIIDVLVLAEEVVAKVSFIKPSPAQKITPNDLYDVVYIKATGLPVKFVPIADEEIFIKSLANIHYLPDIVAHSRSIKVFAPAPNEVVGRKFSVSGVDNTKELSYWLLDANKNALLSGLTMGVQAPGFTRNPVIIEEHLLGPRYWTYFSFDIKVPENIVDGADLILGFGTYEDGVADGVFGEVEGFNIPLKFELD
ncbi:MAG: hypothetical protein KGZ75_03685 [Syntrophomonadaceae bacterium]|nr:hypothetical protein [Syntrophomonadaceae bacterium]